MGRVGSVCIGNMMGSEVGVCVYSRMSSVIGV